MKKLIEIKKVKSLREEAEAAIRSAKESGINPLRGVANLMRASEVMDRDYFDGLMKHAIRGERIALARQKRALKTRQTRWPQYVQAFEGTFQDLSIPERLRMAAGLAGVSPRTVRRAVAKLAPHLLLPK